MLPPCPYPEGWRDDINIHTYNFWTKIETDQESGHTLTDKEWKHKLPPCCPKCGADMSKLSGGTGCGQGGQRRYYHCGACQYVWSENMPKVLNDTNRNRALQNKVPYIEFIFSAKYAPYDCQIPGLTKAEIARKEEKDDRPLGRRPEVKKSYKKDKEDEMDDLGLQALKQQKTQHLDERPDKPWAMPRVMFASAAQASVAPNTDVVLGGYQSNDTMQRRPSMLSLTNGTSTHGSNQQRAWPLQKTMDDVVWNHCTYDMDIEGTKIILKFAHGFWDPMGKLPSSDEGSAIDLMFYSSIARFFYQDPNGISEERKEEIRQLTNMSETYVTLNLLEQNGFNSSQSMTGLYAAARSVMTPPSSMTPVSFMRPVASAISRSPALNSPSLSPFPVRSPSSQTPAQRGTPSSLSSSLVCSHVKRCQCNVVVDASTSNAVQCSGCESYFHDVCYGFSIDSVDTSAMTKWKCKGCTSAVNTYNLMRQTSKPGTCKCGRAYPCPPNAYDELSMWEGSNFRWLNCNRCSRLMHSCCIRGDESLSLEEFKTGGFVCEECE